MYMDQRQKELNDLYWELGKAYYEGGFEDPLPELLPLFNQITHLLRGEVAPAPSPYPVDDYQVDTLEERIVAQASEIAGPRFCAECGHKLRPSAVFCSGCGTPLS